MGAAHTPGPWEVVGQYVRTHFIIGDPTAPGFMVADCGVILEERAANARLIAAAPEMYEALNLARDALVYALAGQEHKGVARLSEPRASGALEVARAAIAKAQQPA